ncbi:MAG: hypothetical protein GJ676_02410 [Rhodobacteraceae bacterium]|nr:hypothetical protein [Paracoccaceae bacterium]
MNDDQIEYEDSVEDFYDDVQDHANITRSLNKYAAILSVLGCILFAILFGGSLLVEGANYLGALVIVASLLSALVAIWVWAIVENSVNSTELLIAIASANERSD